MAYTHNVNDKAGFHNNRSLHINMYYLWHGSQNTHDVASSYIRCIDYFYVSQISEMRNHSCEAFTVQAIFVCDCVGKTVTLRNLRVSNRFANSS